MTTNNEIELKERKKFYKMLLTPMSLEEKLDEIYDLPDEDLSFLMEQFQADEDYEICHAIKTVFDERNPEKKPR
jgi:hypothetical protein